MNINPDHINLEEYPTLRGMLEKMKEELDTVYNSSDLSDQEKRSEFARILC